MFWKATRSYFQDPRGCSDPVPGKFRGFQIPVSNLRCLIQTSLHRWWLGKACVFGLFFSLENFSVFGDRISTWIFSEGSLNHPMVTICDHDVVVRCHTVLLGPLGLIDQTIQLNADCLDLCLGAVSYTEEVACNVWIKFSWITRRYSPAMEHRTLRLGSALVVVATEFI